MGENLRIIFVNFSKWKVVGLEKQPPFRSKVGKYLERFRPESKISPKQVPKFFVGKSHNKMMFKKVEKPTWKSHLLLNY